MPKRKSGGQTVESRAPPEIVCILVVDTMFDDFEVEICANEPRELIKFLQLPWTWAGCALKDQANPP
jgi:hypothetical protein